MASYHFRMTIIKRSEGQSAVGSAAWRSRETLYDERLGKQHKYAHYKDLVDSMILVPAHAPERLRDRQTLWNEVELREKQKNSQLARVIEIALPLELDREQRKTLVVEFVHKIFVDQGMIADIAIIEKDANPFATIMLTMRPITADGFGKKEIGWNNRSNLFKWRKDWADIQNRKLEEAGLDVRVDHRSHAERGIDLEPQIKVGVTAKYLARDGHFLKSTRGLERLDEYQRIKRENGERVIQSPEKALSYLKERNSGVFSIKDLQKFARYHSADASQYQEVLQALQGCPDLIPMCTGKKDENLFSIRTTEDNG